ncbi:hypothetical protein SAMN04488540_1142 [Ferrimonas sediminum]|uniref:Uncharacterized protein n=1 Tax=Ferrimonas sediminum TaxID=718193 RepID=A0A1G8WVW4_9GAMM|nr:hypothetical protein [Ferrimonas sediminum]SDJ81755.1 hypothetical protein SAMN04488540_1142 [Ferrimonas sediminum]
MKKITEFLYGSEEFEFVFDVPIEIAIERLKKGVSTTSRLTSEGMVGNVSSDIVKIQRVIPMVQNSFKPFLVGSFSSDGNKTVLSGVFRFHRFVQAFMTFWFGFIVLWVTMASVAVAAKPTEAWSFPIFGFLMLCFGVGLVKLGKWFSRNDKEWLKDNISNAINKNS